MSLWNSIIERRWKEYKDSKDSKEDVWKVVTPSTSSCPCTCTVLDRSILPEAWKVCECSAKNTSPPVKVGSSKSVRKGFQSCVIDLETSPFCLPLSSVPSRKNFKVKKHTSHACSAGPVLQAMAAISPYTYQVCEILSWWPADGVSKDGHDSMISVNVCCTRAEGRAKWSSIINHPFLVHFWSISRPILIQVFEANASARKNL